MGVQNDRVDSISQLDKPVAETYSIATLSTARRTASMKPHVSWSEPVAGPQPPDSRYVDVATPVEYATAMDAIAAIHRGRKMVAVRVAGSNGLAMAYQSIKQLGQVTSPTQHTTRVSSLEKTHLNNLNSRQLEHIRARLAAQLEVRSRSLSCFPHPACPCPVLHHECVACANRRSERAPTWIYSAWRCTVPRLMPSSAQFRLQRR